MQDINKITDKEVLMKELEHSNKLIQDKENMVNKFTLILISGVSILCFNLIVLLGYFFYFLYQNQDNEKFAEYFKEYFPLLFYYSFYTMSIFVGIFVFIICLDLYNRKETIKRKALVLSLLNKKKWSLNHYYTKKKRFNRF